MSEPLFEQTLSEFLTSHLREDFCYPIDNKRAETLIALNSGLKIPLLHVQYITFDGSKLSQPLLWRWKYWKNAEDKHLADKARSEKERVEKFIRDRNIVILTKALRNKCYLDDNKAVMTAIEILNLNRVGAVRMLGVKLIEKESEL
jgi:hypothetical protein